MASGWRLGKDSVIFNRLATHSDFDHAPMSIWVTQIELGAFRGRGRVWEPKGGKVDLGGMGRECDIRNSPKINKNIVFGERRFIFIYVSMWGRVMYTTCMNTTRMHVPLGITRELESQAVVMSHSCRCRDLNSGCLKEQPVHMSNS